MAIILWLTWRYLDGVGPPRRLAEFRHDHLRARALTPQVWGVALLAGASAVIAVRAAFRAVVGVLQIAAPPGGGDIPVITAIAAMVMTSAVAGVVEEAGFRGYMQLPLERAYGPAVAIATSSILFTLSHLNHGAAVLPFLPFYFAIAVAFGLLTFLTGSILPSMVLHFSSDLLTFALRYAAPQGELIGRAGTGTISMTAAMVSAACIISTVAAFRFLARAP